MTNFHNPFSWKRRAAIHQSGIVTPLSQFSTNAPAREKSMTYIDSRAAFGAALAAVCLTGAPAHAQEAPAGDQVYAIHGQITTVVQGVGGLTSPYTADNSLTPHQTKATTDATLYLGARLWRGGEVWGAAKVEVRSA